MQIDRKRVESDALQRLKAALAAAGISLSTAELEQLDEQFGELLDTVCAVDLSPLSRPDPSLLIVRPDGIKYAAVKEGVEALLASAVVGAAMSFLFPVHAAVGAAAVVLGQARVLQETSRGAAWLKRDES